MHKLKKQLVHYKSELFSLRNKELSESKKSLWSFIQEFYFYCKLKEIYKVPVLKYKRLIVYSEGARG